MNERNWILYIAGPMTGYPQFNIPAFERAADELRQRGHAVRNPVEEDSEETREAALGSSTGSLDHLPPGESWGRMIARDVQIVADQVEGVVLLPGWEKSRGARMEVFTALTVHKPVWELENAAERGYLFDYTTELDPVKAANVFGVYVTETEIPDSDVLPETPCHGCDTLCPACDEAALAKLAKTARELGITDEDTNPYAPNTERITVIGGGEYNLPVYDGPIVEFESYDEEPDVNVLQEADSIVSGDRGKDYGSAFDNAEAFAELASAATGLKVEPEHYAVLMICVKLARLRGGVEWHRDTWVDIAGYSRVAEMVEEG